MFSKTANTLRRHSNKLFNATKQYNRAYFTTRSGDSIFTLGTAFLMITSFGTGVYVHSLLDKVPENSATNVSKENSEDNYDMKWTDQKTLLTFKMLNSVFQKECERGDATNVERHLDNKNIDPSANNNQAIRLACRNGHIKVVELLLKHEKVNPGDNDNEAIKEASKNNHHDIVKLLLRNERVNPGVESSDDENAIRSLAIKNGLFNPVVKLMINEREEEDKKLMKKYLENKEQEANKIKNQKE